MNSLPLHSAASQTHQLRFSEDDLLAFADASGDWNPLHIDADFARGTPFGRCVVHGSLLTLGALGCLPNDVLTEVRGLELTFGGAVLVGEPVTAETRYSDKANAWEVRLSGRGKLLTRVVARPGVLPGVDSRPSDPISRRPMRVEPFAPELADEPAVGDQVEGAYGSKPAFAEIARHRNAGALDPALVEALGWASYIVGMEVPGLHGVFAAAKLSLLERDPKDGAGGYSLRAREHDPRTERLVADGRLETRSGATVAAVIECFRRRQLPELDAAALLPATPRPASGRSVVVIGGSRGFGAAATLALLGGGHETHAVYSTTAGVLGAANVGAHEERLILHRADAQDPGQLTPLREAIVERGLPLRGIVLAAALPPLAMGLTAESALPLSEYVAASIRLVAVPLGALMPLLDDQGFILFCSSSAVTAPPRDWPHYVAAKGALEYLASWAVAAAPGVRSVVVRLPKLATAMTNSPSMRIGATAPEAIAGRLIARLEGDDFPSGLTILEAEEL